MFGKTLSCWVLKCSLLHSKCKIHHYFPFKTKGWEVMIGDTIDLLVYLMKNSFHTRNCELSQFLCLPSYLFIYRFCIFYFVSSLQEIAFNCTLFSVSPILEYPIFDLSFTRLKVPYIYPFSLSHDTVTLTPIVVTHSTLKLTSLYEIFSDFSALLTRYFFCFRHNLGHKFLPLSKN